MTSAGKKTSKLAGKLDGQDAGELSPLAEGAELRPARPARRAVPVRPALELNDTERAQLCIESLCALRTIHRWAAGLPVERTTQVRLERAMARLGIQKRERQTHPPSGRRRIVAVQRVA